MLCTNICLGMEPEVKGDSWMYRVAVCEDEEQQRELVKRILVGLSVKTDTEFEIELFPSGEDLISHYGRGGAPSIS